MEHTAERINNEIEARREIALEKFYNSEIFRALEQKRDAAEARLKERFDKKDYAFVEDCIDAITEFYYEMSVYLYHDAYGDFLTLPEKK